MNDLKDYTSGKEEAKAVDMDDWKDHQMKLLSLIYPAISDRIRCLKGDMKTRLDKLRRILTASIPSGALVMIKDPQRKDKFEPKYIGPYTITRRAQNGAYVLRDEVGDIVDRHVPADQIKLISKKPRGKDADRVANTYVVSHISDHKGEALKGTLRFLTHWKGYDDAEATWEPPEHFDDDGPIRAYWQRRKQQEREPKRQSQAL